MKQHPSQFNSFFSMYAKNVDLAQGVYFWKLLDDIILALIRKHIPSPLSKNRVILDAGGGTGRWIEILSRLYKSNFILFDKSPDMLRAAQAKKSLQHLGDRLRVVEGDIQKMSAIADNSIDYLISIYNPVSFVEKPSAFFGEIKRILRPGGRALVMGQGFHNAIASKINNYVASEAELTNLERLAKVKWASYVPALHVFSQETIADLAKKSKLRVLSCYGVSVFIQPGPEDFDSKNKKLSRVSKALKGDKKLYRRIFELEMKYNSQDSLVNRGVNILVALQKS